MSYVWRFFPINWGSNFFVITSFQHYIFWFQSCYTLFKIRSCIWWHFSFFCNDRSMSFKFNLWLLLKSILTLILLRQICLMLFKAFCWKNEFHLLCYSHLIQALFKTWLFFYYAISPHVHCDVVYMLGNIWIILMWQHLGTCQWIYNPRQLNVSKNIPLNILQNILICSCLCSLNHQITSLKLVGIASIKGFQRPCV